MNDEATAKTSHSSKAEPMLGDDVEVTICFELERLHVPLGELRTWREGEAVRLDRGIDEPIRLVLRQPGGDRLLGHGRVVVLDGLLGVVVESWATSMTTTSMAAPSADKAAASEAETN